MAKTNGVKEFLLKHGLQIFLLILTGFGVVMVYQTKVDANAQANVRQDEDIKRIDAKYPDKAWFDLKFEYIEKRLDRFENKLDSRATINRF